MNIEVRGVCTLLQVFDMPESVRFYRDVLGFEIVQSDFKYLEERNSREVFHE